MDIAPLSRPTSKSELLQQLHDEYNALSALIERIPIEQRLLPISGSPSHLSLGASLQPQALSSLQPQALSVKDILAHITDWEAWMLRCIRSAAVGEYLPPRNSISAKSAPEEASDEFQPRALDEFQPRALEPSTDASSDAAIDAINAEIYERYHDADWETIWNDFRHTHEECIVEIEQLSESDLFDPQRTHAITGRDYGAAIDFITGDTTEHYREHADELRAAFGL